MELNEEEKKAIEIIEETHDMLVNPKLREEKYTTDDFEKASYVVIMLIRKQQKEIEEKTTILLAGAEKVKQLEKGNRSLMESRIKWKNRYYKEKEKNKENQVLIDDIKDHRIVYIDTPEFEEKFISKDKIREKIKKAKEINWHIPKLVIEYFEELLEDN